MLSEISLLPRSVLKKIKKKNTGQHMTDRGPLRFIRRQYDEIHQLQKSEAT